MSPRDGISWAEKEVIGLSETGLGLDELVRQGARQVIQQAIEAELAELLERFANVKTMHGQRAVVRNGYLPEREVLTAAGPIPVKVPKVSDRSGSGVKFNSSIVPPYVRGLRSENSDGQCLLVIIGVRPDGSKERVAIGDGYRETKASWLELLLDLKARGLQGGPLLAVGAGHRADHRAREARPRYAMLLAQRTNRRRPACRAVRSRLQPALAAARHRPAGHQACSFRFSSSRPAPVRRFYNDDAAFTSLARLPSISLNEFCRADYLRSCKIRYKNAFSNRHRL
jgi:Transposase, Mutator family